MKILLSKTGYWRKEQFRVRTDLVEFNNKIVVQKIPLGIESKRILSDMEKTYIEFKNRMSKNVFLSKPIKTNSQSFSFEFNKGPMLEKMIEDALIKRDFAQSASLYFNGCKIVSSLPSYKNKVKNEKNFIKFFNIEKKYYDLELDFINPALTELTADHIIYNNGKYFIIDYEVFFDFPIPREFVLFRYQFHLLNTLQQVIGAISSQLFTLNTYLRDLYIPSIWDFKYKIDRSKKELFLDLEKRKQEHLNWEKIDFDRFRNYKEGVVDIRSFPRFTKSQAEAKFGSMAFELENRVKEVKKYKTALNKIQSAKFYRLWQSYCRFRDNFFSIIKAK